MIYSNLRIESSLPYFLFNPQIINIVAVSICSLEMQSTLEVNNIILKDKLTYTIKKINKVKYLFY